MCHDPFLSCLEAFGYCVVRLPMADLAPLEMLLRSGDDLERLGSLATALEPRPGARLPRISRDRPAPTITGRRTGHLDVSVGLSLLGSVVAAMGGTQVGLDEAYRSAHTLTFEFRDVTEDRIEVVDLDQYLAGSRVSRRSAHIATLLDADDIYVTTAVVKSRSLGVDARDENGVSVSVQVPALQQLAAGRVAIGQSGETASTIVYTGDTPLAFGFRAVRLFYDGGRYGAFAPLPAGEAGLRHEGGMAEYLRGGLVRLGAGQPDCRHEPVQSGCHDRGRPLDCHRSGCLADARGDGARER
jgi:hypothetical protein